MEPSISSNAIDVASWDYFTSDIKLCAVKRGISHHFEVRGNLLEAPECTVETIFGWVPLSEISEKENLSEFYANFKPVIQDKISLILSLIQCEIIVDPSTKKNSQINFIY